MATTGRTAPRPEEIEAQVTQIRDDIATLTRLLGELAGAKVDEAKGFALDEAEAAIGRARTRAEAVPDRATGAAHSIEAYIEEKPLQSAMIALAAGLFIGLLTRR
jgi:ElaB/YqjD/DUF883 family membrane-anchored ribosome-binding protein